MCIIKEFCCGCTLRAGAITAAVLTGTVTVCAILSGIQCLRLVHIEDNHFQPDGDYNHDEYHRKTYDIDLPNDAVAPFDYNYNEGTYDADIRFLSFTGGTMLGVGLISLVIFICLVIGIIKVKAGFIVPWLLGSMIQIVLSCISIMFLIVMGVYTVFFSLIGISLDVYLWIVVLNYYRQLRSAPPADTLEIKSMIPIYDTRML